MKQEYINKIMDLGKCLSREDRERMFTDLEISEPTGMKYLAGDIKKFDIADAMIDWMEKQSKKTKSRIATTR